MDAFHFMGGITLEDFSKKAEFYGVELKEYNEIKTYIKYFERDYNGVKLTVAVPFFNFNYELSFNTLRQLCNQLKIPMKNFAVQI